jgi:hypothetical protein
MSKEPVHSMPPALELSNVVSSSLPYFSITVESHRHILVTYNLQPTTYTSQLFSFYFPYNVKEQEMSRYLSGHLAGMHRLVRPKLGEWYPSQKANLLLV